MSEKQLSLIEGDSDSSSVRVSLSLPVSLRNDLDTLSSHLSITRSALVSNLLLETVPDLILLLNSIPDQPTENDLIRARGKSLELIGERISRLFTTELDGGDK